MSIKEKGRIISYIKVLRTLRDDPEGYFRWHWLLFDSLDILFETFIVNKMDELVELIWGQ